MKTKVGHCIVRYNSHGMEIHSGMSPTKYKTTTTKGSKAPTKQATTSSDMSTTQK